MSLVLHEVGRQIVRKRERVLLSRRRPHGPLFLVAMVTGKSWGGFSLKAEVARGFGLHRVFERLQIGWTIPETWQGAGFATDVGVLVVGIFVRQGFEPAADVDLGSLVSGKN